MTGGVRLGVGPVGRRVPRYALDTLDAALEGLWWGDNVLWIVDDSDDVDHLLAAVTASADCTDVTASTFSRAVFDIRISAPREAVSDAARTVLREGRIAVWICHHTTVPEDLVELAQVIVDVSDGRLRIDRADGRRGRVQGMELKYQVHDAVVEVGPASTVSRLGESLRAIRKQRGWSQADLAGMIGVSGSAISQTERGQHSLSLDTVIDLAERLGVSVDRLVRGADRPYRLDRSSSSTTAVDGPGSARRVKLPGRATVTLSSESSVTQTIMVASGVVRLLFADDSIVLRPGDIVTVAGEHVRSWRNLTAHPALLFRVDST